MTPKILLVPLFSLAVTMAHAGPCEDKAAYCNGSAANASKCESASARCSSAGDMMSKARQGREREAEGNAQSLDEGLKDLPKEQADTIRKTLESFQLPGGLGK